MPANFLYVVLSLDVHFLFALLQKELVSQKDLEQEAALKHSCEELEAKKKEVLLLENQVKDLEQKLQLADSKSKEKVRFISTCRNTRFVPDSLHPKYI